MPMELPASWHLYNQFVYFHQTSPTSSYPASNFMIFPNCGLDLGSEFNDVLKYVASYITGI